ncbi:MAG TPA: ABC transporter permease [Acidimicrobiales bacterium]|nr:ABC transporter permease [Acidimicrobiales bacterium]
MAQAAVTTGDRSPELPALPLEAGQGVTPLSVLKAAIQRREATVIVVTIGAILYFAVRAPAFHSVANIIVICQYIAPIMVIGAGEVLMLVLAEIDLSAGQVYLTAPWFAYWFWTGGVPFGFAVIIALALSVAIGLINGLFTVRLGVPSLIVTLGTLYTFFGFVLVKSSYTQEEYPGRGVAGSGAPDGWTKYFGVGSWSTILWGLGITLLIWFLLKRTRFGVHTTAAGGNLLGAAEAGVPVKRIKVWCFMIIAVAAGFMGILDSVRIGSINPGNSGLDIVLTPIVAAVIGGTALTGGRATVLGTIIGAIFLGILEDGLNIIGVQASWFFFFEGVIILIAMAANVQLGRLAVRFRR